MSKTRRTQCRCLTARANAMLAAAWSAARSAWRTLRRRPATPIEVLVEDGARRRTVERLLRRGLGRLERIVPPPRQPVAIVVQQALEGDRPLAGRIQVAELPDGTRTAIVRLALLVDGHRQTPDALLAALSDQWLALAAEHQVGAPTAVEPTEALADRPAPLTALRADPLVPQPNGRGAGRTAA